MGSFLATIRLGDIGTIVTGTTPAGTLEDNWGGAAPFLTPSDIEGQDYSPSVERWISVAALERAKSRTVPAGSTAVVCIGATIGKVARVNQTSLTNQQINTVVPDGRYFDNQFIYYKLGTLGGHLRAIAGGSATPIISKSKFAEVEVSCPALGEQRRIAKVLGGLDDLITTNGQLVAAQVALVHAEFERCFGKRELEVPVGKLGEVIDCLHSKKPERVRDGPHVLIQLNNIRNDGMLDMNDGFLISTADYSRWSKNLETRPFDIVITNVGRVGAVARVPVGVTAALGRNMTAIRLHDVPSDAPFVSSALLSSGVRREIESKTDAGTILNALNVRSISKLRLPRSTEGERRDFSDWASPLLEASDSLLSHNRELRATRDELLPLLMAGKVRVGDLSEAGVQGDK
jgi:restriction endonuclease S subunit